MQSCKDWCVRQMLILLTIVGMASLGCDQIKSAVNGEKPAVTEDAQSSTPAPVLPTPGIPIQPPVTAAPPSPDQLLEEFRSLKPHEITDRTLARVASRPESASAITELEIQGDEFTGTGIELLTTMENLTSLSLKCPSLGPEELSLLGRVTSLKTLGIGATKTNDDVVGALTALTDLESLDLSMTGISPAAGAPLSRFAHLQVLDLDSTAADDSTIAAITSLPIRILSLNKTNISNASLASIKKLRSLESLEVAFCSVTGAGFQGYGSSGLKRLVVGETPFGLEGFIAIKGMKSLEELNVYNAGLVQHKSANVFRTFPNLKILNAGRSALTNEGMDVFFKGLRPLEELHLMHCNGITDQGLAALVGIKTLKVLEVQGTGCTANGAQTLKQKIPDCKIYTNDATL
ncbi:MAG: hypothetical protein O2856_04370 [Planctomycetota bacterium]|nr:hypothetical protein [Planctomycetota bacterium]